MARANSFKESIQVVEPQVLKRIVQGFGYAYTYIHSLLRENI
jgi:hypothetical protein